MGNNGIKDAGSLLICFKLSKLFKIGGVGNRIPFQKVVGYGINIYIAWIIYCLHWKAVVLTDFSYKDSSLPAIITFSLLKLYKEELRIVLHKV